MYKLSQKWVASYAEPDSRNKTSLKYSIILFDFKFPSDIAFELKIFKSKKMLLHISNLFLNLKSGSV